jgi:hypothetical protein
LFIGKKIETERINKKLITRKRINGANDKNHQTADPKENDKQSVIKTY